MLKQIRRIKSFSFQAGSRYDANWKNKYSPTVEETTAALGPIFSQLFDAQRLAVQQTNKPYNFKGNYPVYQGGVKPDIPTKLVECSEPLKPKFKDFKRRSAAGEILLSDYHNWQAFISYTNGQRVESLGAISKEYVTPGKYKIGTYSGDYIFANGYWWNGRVDSVWQTENLSEELTPFDVGWRDPSYEFFDSWLGTSVDGPAVQEELADHNDRTVDALTALAEMPETAASIVNGVKVILRMYLDARKRAFRLQNKVSEWKNAKTSDKNRRQVLRNIEELQSAISDVWLNFRYNIMPNVYLVEDLIKAHNAAETLFLRDRSRSIQTRPFYEPPNPLNWSGTHKMDVTERVMIKSRLNVNSTKFDQQYSIGGFKTAWELIPLSFVVDWVISVGDFITASFPPAHAEQGATYSWKCGDEVYYKHTESGAQVTIRYQAYNRKVIDPSQYCKLYWVPDIDTVRQMDALALSWNIFIKQHFKKLS